MTSPNGIIRCECGCKYWLLGRCVDCGDRIPSTPVKREEPHPVNDPTTRYEVWTRQTAAATFEYGVYVWRSKGLCGPAVETTTIHGIDAAQAFTNVKTAIRERGYLLVGDWRVRESYDGITLERDAVIA